MIYELTAYNTDQRYGDVRYREYTSSERRAKSFSQIPKIQFTDSGHGIVFSARPYKGKRKPRIMVLSDYVGENLAKLKDTESGDKKKMAKSRKVKINIKRKDVHGVERSKDFFSLALFLETQLVDYGGLVATEHMNSEDMGIAEEMGKEGLITFKRLPGRYVFNRKRNMRHATYRVEFSDKMWEISHKERRDRAERMIPESKQRTGEEEKEN